MYTSGHDHYNTIRYQLLNWFSSDFTRKISSISERRHLQKNMLLIYGYSKTQKDKDI